jgi:hypothetical protein
LTTIVYGGCPNSPDTRHYFRDGWCQFCLTALHGVTALRTEEFRDVLADLGDCWEGMPPTETLEWAIGNYGRQIRGEDRVRPDPVRTRQ